MLYDFKKRGSDELAIAFVYDYYTFKTYDECCFQETDYNLITFAHFKVYTN